MVLSKQKKILLLGGLHFLIPVIDSIRKLGYYSITCDYLPNNVAHKKSDEYQNVSVVEKDDVLELAKRLRVDGIMSFACDTGVETAAYVAEKLGLPSVGSYEAVSILQNKAKFRRFLAENNFNVPKARGYFNVDDALADVDTFRWPVIVKPVDSAGSKGVSKIEKVEELRQAAENATRFSLSKQFIVEEFIQQKGCSSDTDSFSVDGRLVFASFNNQLFDTGADNPYTPAAYSWPSSMSTEIQCELRNELQRLMTLLKLKNSIYNIETRLGTDGKAYIMEVSPRGGGNRLAEVLQLATGTDLITNAVHAAVGNEIIGIEGDPVYDGFWAEAILHADEDGVFETLSIDSSLEKHVVESDLWVRPGDTVQRFSGANATVGTLVMKFDSHEQMTEHISNIGRYAKIVVKR